MGAIRVAVCGERGLCPPFGDLLKGAEWWFWAGDVSSPIETRNVVGDG